MLFLTFAVAAATHAVSATSGTQIDGPSLSLSVAKDASFTVALNGNLLLRGGDVAVDSYSSSSGTLKLQSAPVTGSGSDKLGQFSSTTATWVQAGNSKALVTTTFKTYEHDSGMIVFEQAFPNGVSTSPVSVGSDPGSFAKCRVAATASTITTSANGYTAYSVGSDGSITPHPNAYCDDNHHYSFTGDVNETECAAECKKSHCSCFDYGGHSGGGGHHKGSGGSSRTLFPAFFRNSGPSDELSAFSYHGVFPGMRCSSVSDYSQSHQGGVPLVIYNASDSTLPMVVFSPLDHAKAHHMASSTNWFGAGVKDTVTDIPVGWSQSFILSAGAGINAGMMSWGDRMLAFTGKPRADKYRDTTHSTIGFWTDNGGYYHYATGTNKSATYEEVLPKVKAYHDSIGVPFGHWQFDSWFYPKDGGVNAGGGGGAVVNWTAMPSVFPSGMAAIQNKLKVPMVMHNRQWSDKSDYIHNWTDIPWYTSKFAIPENPAIFFERFFTQQEGWGLTMYEQDWMCTEYDGVEQLQTNISLGDLWLEGMAIGAASSNRTIQYCMPYPNDLLSASAYSAVTNARATGDYFHGPNQWAVGHTSLFYWAIGILPFKDGFYSSSLPQIGGQTVGPEKNPDREIIMATLSTAMVGPMDGINLLNASRVMASCRSDGVVLKPDRPISVSDTCFCDKCLPSMCYTYTTYSDISGLGRVHYVFENDGSKSLTPASAHLDKSDGYAVFNWYSKSVGPLQMSNTVAPGYENHIYAMYTPIVGEWAFIGESSKYVPAASIRFLSVATHGSSGINVQVSGVANETVSVCAASTSDWKLVCKDQHFSTTSTLAVSFP